MDRPAVFVNVQMALSASALAELLLKAFLSLHPLARVKDALTHFRVKPTISYNLENNGFDVSFSTSEKRQAALEDVLNLMDTCSRPESRLIVVLDEFQEIVHLEAGTDKLLRAVMQLQKNINYVFLVREESMMTAIFEDIHSPFFHFGALLRLSRIPLEDFRLFLVERLSGIRGSRAAEDADDILALTKGHTFYTQQLAAVFWDHSASGRGSISVKAAAEIILRSLSASYSVIWSRLNRTQRRVLEVLARGGRLQDIRDAPASTFYAASGRLRKDGLLVREEGGVELEDPFFALWIRRAMAEASAAIPSGAA